MSSGACYVGDSHALLSAVRALIDAAEQSIVLQMYLFAANGDQTSLLPRDGAFAYADTVAGWLIAKKRARPSITVVVIIDSNTPDDPTLTRRRGELVAHRMRREGIIVLCANLFRTRFERRKRLLGAMNFHLDHGPRPHHRWVELQNRWQVLHNVEDHRKNLVIDAGRAGAITSHNFFDAAHDWHENLFWLTGDAARRLFSIARVAINHALEIPQQIDDDARRALASLTAQPPRPQAPPLAPRLAPVDGYGAGHRGPWPEGLIDDDSARLVENERIKGRLRALFDQAAPGDTLLVAVTYFSDLDMLACLERAAARGVVVRVLIDSIDALPLPPAMGWLIRNHVNHRVTARAARLVELYADRFFFRVHHSTEGAMMHLKTAARLGPRPAIIGGQANFTPNSFSGAWLETDLESTSPALVAAFAAHFERLWSLPRSRPLARPRGLRAAASRHGRTLVLSAFELVGLRP